VRFDRCTFSGTEGRTLFYIRRVRDVVIADSAVKNNRSTHLIFGANLMTDRVSVIRSRFENNAALRLSDSNSRIRFTESVFTGNSFDKK
jgi:predicted LPLAT superfamily acyltransferase